MEIYIYRAKYLLKDLREEKMIPLLYTALKSQKIECF
jgi:hypothetical protein